MFDYLQKFNQLPKDLRDKVSAPAVMAAVNELEKKYGVNLAAVIMKVMVKDIAIAGLSKYFIEEDSLNVERAKELAREIEEKVFSEVKDYLVTEAGGQEKRQEALQQIRGEPFQQASSDTKAMAGKDALADKQGGPIQQAQGGEEKIAKVEAEKETPIVKGASFFFSPEDEEEIRELTKKINGGLKVSLTDEQLEDKLNKIITLTQINFGSQELFDRFKSILKTYLRGIRDRIETKQTLKKTFSDGGLGFDNNSVDEVLKIADSIMGGEKVPARPPVRIRLPEDEMVGKEKEEKTTALKDIGVRDIDYSFSSSAALKENKEDVPGPPVKLPTEGKERREQVKLDVSHEISPPPPAVLEKQPVAEKIKAAEPSRAEPKIPIKDSIAPPAPEFKRPAAKAPLRMPTLPQSAGKKKMEDVKYVPPKVMNPIDELRYMDLVNFRRLSPEAGKQVAKIKEKINLLEEENYSRRTEGIKGWRQSPVNKLYLSIGQQSISESKPVDVIIEERKNTGQDYLTLEEFKAVMDLNKELRF